MNELHGDREVAASCSLSCFRSRVLLDDQLLQRQALRLFPNVYGVCVMFPSAHLEPGVVRANCSPVPGILDIGRFPNGIDRVAEARRLIPALRHDRPFERPSAVP